MTEQDHLVFVYGTLRKGGRNHHLIKVAELVSENCWTTGELYDTEKGYPAMIQHHEHRVYGELYRVTSDQLREIDFLEGYIGPGEENHYDRVVQKVYTGDDQFEALVYVYDSYLVRGLVRIGSGEWN